MDGVLYRGEVFFFVDSPLDTSNSYRYFEDGGLAVMNGKVLETGPFNVLYARYAGFEQVDFSGFLIMPGLIDTHIHFSQSEMLGMYGKQLLDWLNEYTFLAEEGFSSNDYARHIARLFVNELVKNGTTTCAAYTTVFASSVRALFEAASEYDMCILAGKVMMDRNAPEQLQDNVKSGFRDTLELIEEWDGYGRNHYVITPRFAITSTWEQLESAGQLHRKFPDTYIQTHLSENLSEIAKVLTLFPKCSDYLEVYEQAGLVTNRSIFGHCVHLTRREYERLSKAKSVIAHCPTSNLFLGSGLFHMTEANRYGLNVTFATDVGAGTSFSMWRTMGEAYKIQQLNGYSMTALEALYKCSLGAARALGLNDHIGSFLPGQDADFIVMDCAVTTAQSLRKDYLSRKGKWTIENKLFGLQILGDERNVKATYIMGKQIGSCSGMEK